MDILKAEEYLTGRLEMLSDEKALLMAKVKKIYAEIEEIDIKIVSMDEEIDKAVDIFSPNSKKNNFTKIEIQKLQKHKDELKMMSIEMEERYKFLENEIILINGALGQDVDNESNSYDNDTKENIENKSYGIKILESQEEERKRIARELHDSIVQVLTNLVHKCEICMKIVDVDPIRAKLELEIMSKTIRNAIGEMRDIIYDLRPMSFDDLGLDITLDRAIRLIDAETDMNVRLKIEGEKRELPGIVQLTIFRIIQECANNSIKYSNGENLTIRVIYEEDSVVLDIQDDGVGFENTDKVMCDNINHTGFGLNMMRERVDLMSGCIEINSSLGEGTRIIVTIPV